MWYLEAGGGREWMIAILLMKLVEEKSGAFANPTAAAHGGTLQLRDRLPV